MLWFREEIKKLSYSNNNSLVIFDGAEIENVLKREDNMAF